MAYAVYGTGGFAREVLPLLREIWLHREAMLPSETAGDANIVFVDDAVNAPKQYAGVPVIDFAALASTHNHRKVVVAIGNGETRHRIEEKCLKAGLSLHTLIAPTARVLNNVVIGAGSVICDGVILTSDIKIGRSFQANLHSYVAHDCVIGDHVTFAPRVNCNGNVHIGNNVYVGTGAIFIQGENDAPLTIGDGAIIGMGSVVTKPVPARTVVAGSPARAIRSTAP